MSTLAFNRRGVWAIYKFEMARFRRTLLQSVVTPVLTTSLYLVVFGSAIGSRMAQVNGVRCVRAPLRALVRDRDRAGLRGRRIHQVDPDRPHHPRYLDHFRADTHPASAPDACVAGRHR